MREIKFRAQQSNDNRWQYFTLDALAQCQAAVIGKGFIWKNWGEYSGFRDKNGTDIYEGDIVQTEFTPINYYDSLTGQPVFGTKTQRKTVVAFKAGAFQSDVSTTYLDYGLIEIIGNVYDNYGLVV